MSQYHHTTYKHNSNSSAGKNKIPPPQKKPAILVGEITWDSDDSISFLYLANVLVTLCCICLAQSTLSTELWFFLKTFLIET